MILVGDVPLSDLIWFGTPYLPMISSKALRAALAEVSTIGISSTNREKQSMITTRMCEDPSEDSWSEPMVSLFITMVHMYVW